MNNPQQASSVDAEIFVNPTVFVRPLPIHMCTNDWFQLTKLIEEQVRNDLHSSSVEPSDICCCLKTGRTVLIKLVSTSQVRSNQHRNLVVC